MNKMVDTYIKTKKVKAGLFLFSLESNKEIPESSYSKENRTSIL